MPEFKGNSPRVDSEVSPDPQPMTPASTQSFVRKTRNASSEARARRWILKRAHSKDMTDQHELILLGAGGAGIEALMVAQRMATWSVLGFADDGKRENVDGLPVLGGIAEVLERHSGLRSHFHCAMGDNRDRRRMAEIAESRGLIPANLVDPSAFIAPSATMGAGVYAAPFSFVGPQARVGRHVLLNVGVSVGHHSDLSDYCQLCPGARVSGKSVPRSRCVRGIKRGRGPGGPDGGVVVAERGLPCRARRPAGIFCGRRARADDGLSRPAT